MRAELPELWCCERCESIGSAQDAQTHEAESGHTVRKLNAAETDGLREIWREEGRDAMGRADLGIAPAMIAHGRELARALRGHFGSGLDGPDF